MISASKRVRPVSAVFLLAFAACAGKDESESATSRQERRESAHPAPAKASTGSTEPLAPASFAGSITLASSLASNKAGSVFVNVYRAGDAGKPGALPYLSRRYEIDDPDWTARDGAVVRYFGLSNADRVGDAKLPLAEQLEIEASYDPDGLSGTRQGVVRSVSPVKNGQDQIELSIRPKASDSTATITPGKGG